MMEVMDTMELMVILVYLVLGERRENKVLKDSTTEEGTGSIATGNTSDHSKPPLAMRQSSSSRETF